MRSLSGLMTCFRSRVRGHAKANRRMVLGGWRLELLV